MRGETANAATKKRTAHRERATGDRRILRETPTRTVYAPPHQSTERDHREHDNRREQSHDQRERDDSGGLPMVSAAVFDLKPGFPRPPSNTVPVPHEGSRLYCVTEMAPVSIQPTYSLPSLHNSWLSLCIDTILGSRDKKSRYALPKDGESIHPPLLHYPKVRTYRNPDKQRLY